MDIHKPKPWHGVREFLKEYVIIVVGVLTALAAEQGVEWLHWRQAVAEAKQGISVELGGLMGLGEARADNLPCVEHRLNELASLVDAGERSGQLPAFGPPGFPGTNGWSSGVWESAVTGQISTHLSRSELRAYTGTYNFVALIASTNRREIDVWTTLYGLAGPGRRFQPTEAAFYRQAIAEARTLDNSIAATALHARQVADAGRLGRDDAFYRRYRDGASAAIRSSLCQPVPRVTPSHYGASPLDGAPEKARANPLTAKALGYRY